jgi:hypothetical protein
MPFSAPDTFLDVTYTEKRETMKIVVIGGTGLIGSKLVAKLRDHGHDAVPASLDTGVNTLTGAGLAQALRGADVVVDVSNSRTFDGPTAINFFTTSTRNLLAAEAEAGVRHHVALSVVGTERLLATPYFQAKNAQEDLIKTGPIPYSIVHATQFFEFMKSIADDATTGNTVRVSSALIQPMPASTQQHLQLRSPDPRQHTLILPENRLGECALGCLELENFLFDRVERDETRGDHAPRLPDAMGAVDRLSFHGGIPPRVEQVDVVGGGEVETVAARLETDQKKRDARVALEAIDARLPVPDPSIQVLIGDS